MEACSGAHHWARLFAAHGHTVRLMAPKFVVPYGLSGKRGKNDAADAAAICEAVARPSMRFVPDKNLQQQSELLVHRARQVFVQQRTATLNRIRGLLSEFGVVLPLKAATVRREAMRQLEDLPGWANTVIGDLLSKVSRLDERIAQYDRHIEVIAKASAPQLPPMRQDQQSHMEPPANVVDRIIALDPERPLAAAISMAESGLWEARRPDAVSGLSKVDLARLFAALMPASVR
jgi:hypothetical protein